MSTSGIHASSADRRASGRAGFSLVELIATIAIIALLTAITVSLVGDDPGSAKNAKLQSDITTLNQMIAIYSSDGTSLSGLTAQEVLTKLKRIRPQSEWKGNVGVASGRLIDTRLLARTTTAPDSDNNPRAKWNSKTLRFELTTAGGTAISEFYLDESLAGTDFGTDNTRLKNIVAFNSNPKGWVWSTGANPQAARLAPRSDSPYIAAGGFDPNETAPGSPNPPADNNGGGGGGPGGDPGPTGPIITKLPRPIISPTGGTFGFQAFPAAVSISSNGAIPEASQLLYRIGGGTWLPYTGPIPLTPAMTLDAVNQTTRPAEYSMSLINSQTYYRLTGSFSGTGDGNWGNAIGGTNLVTNIDNNGAGGTTTFKHGNTKLDLGNGEYLDAGVENVLSFKPEQFDTITPNTWFDFGELTMLNGTTFYNSEASGVTLSVNLKLTQPALDFTTHIALGFNSTENTSDRLASADSVELKNPTTDVHIIIDGVEYRLELSWATLDPGAGVVDGNKFLIFEGATAKAVLRARFTSNH